MVHSALSDTSIDIPLHRSAGPEWEKDSVIQPTLSHEIKSNELQWSSGYPGCEMLG